MARREDDDDGRGVVAEAVGAVVVLALAVLTAWWAFAMMPAPSWW